MRAFWRSPTLQFKSFLRHLHGERATSQNAPSQRKVLFSGQGSQYVGMTSKLPQTHAVDSIYAAASSVLGYDLRALCLEGPQERLNETIHCQPAVVVGSLAALEELKSRDQSKVELFVVLCMLYVLLVISLSFPRAILLWLGLVLENLQH